MVKPTTFLFGSLLGYMIWRFCKLLLFGYSGSKALKDGSDTHGDSSKQENDDGLFGTGAIVNPLSFEQVDITTGAAGSKHDFTIRSSHAYDFSDEEEANSHRSNLKDASIPENGTDFHLVQ